LIFAFLCWISCMVMSKSNHIPDVLTVNFSFQDCVASHCIKSCLLPMSRLFNTFNSFLFTMIWVEKQQGVAWYKQSCRHDGFKRVGSFDKSWSFLKPYHIRRLFQELKKMDTDILKYVRHLELGALHYAKQNSQTSGKFITNHHFRIIPLGTEEGSFPPNTSSVNLIQFLWLV